MNLRHHARSGFRTRNRKAMVYGLLLLALFFKLSLVHYYYFFDADRMEQAFGTRSFVQGQGISVPVVESNNLSAVSYLKLVAWPPGYSLLLAPFYLLTNDLKLSSLLADFLAVTLFLVVYWRLLKKLGFPNRHIAILLLFNALAFPQDMLYSAPTDLLSVALLLLALHYVIFLSVKNRTTVLHGVVAGGLCFLPALLRYLYLPVVPLIPFALLCHGSWQRRRPAVVTALAALVVIFGASAAEISFLLSPHSFDAALAAGVDTSVTLQLGGLRYLHPFLFTALINVRLVVLQASRFTHLAYTSIMQAVTIAHFFVLAAVALLAGAWVWKQKRRTEDKWTFFLRTSLLLSGAVVTVLCLLSLLTNPRTNLTYVQEERYFKFIAVVLPVVLLRFLYNKSRRSPGRLYKAAYRGLLLVFGVGILHGVYFVAKEVFPFRMYDTNELNRSEAFIKSFIQTRRAMGINVTVAGSRSFYYGCASYYNAGAIYKSSLLNGPVYADEPTVLLVVFAEGARPDYEGFLAKPGVTLEAVQNKTYFYSLYIGPGSAALK